MKTYQTYFNVFRKGKPISDPETHMILIEAHSLSEAKCIASKICERPTFTFIGNGDTCKVKSITPLPLFPAQASLNEVFLICLKHEKTLGKAKALFQKKTLEPIPINLHACGNLSGEDLAVIANELTGKLHRKDDFRPYLKTLLNGSRYDKQELITGKELETCRVCSHCGQLMREGYCVDDGGDYYCSDECLKAHCGEEEAKELLSTSGEDDARMYWTAWEG